MTLVDKNLKQNKKFLLNAKILVEKKRGGAHSGFIQCGTCFRCENSNLVKCT